MNPGAESGGSHAGDVLATLASGLGVDSRESGRKALEVVRARSPELVTISEETGEDLITTSAGFIEMLLASLRSDLELPWIEFGQRSRDYGRLRAAQGMPLESLIELLAVYRRATTELLSWPIQAQSHYDEIIALAYCRLEDVTQRGTTAIACGHPDYLHEEHVGTIVDRLFSASDLLFMAAVADQVAIAIDRARQFASEARTDHLTGLANRREFERVMEREVALAERHNRRLSLMMIDLDNLKRINDRLGHSAGDGALRLVAQQLQRVVRASDVCARVGGDEFAVAMPETDLDRARDVATRLRRAVEHAAMGMRAPEHVDVSLGIAAWRPGQDWQAVYQGADTDLYEDKRRRKTVRRWQQEDQPAPSIRILGRAGGRRRVSGA